MAKRERPDLSKAWPEQTRPHYIKLFSLQERLRARIKLAQELAVHNLEVKYPGNIRKTNPIPVVGKQQPKDYLKEYLDEQLPYIRYYLSRMQGEIEQIKKAYRGGRPPKWSEIITGSPIKVVDGVKTQEFIGVENLAVQIWEKMDDIQVHLLLTLKGDSQAIKESNQVIIDETKKVIKTASKIRTELLFLRPTQTILGSDEFGIYDVIIDQIEPGADEQVQDEQQQHFIDLTTIPTWQQDLHKKKQR